jgi:hypothetical protein
MCLHCVVTVESVVVSLMAVPSMRLSFAQYVKMIGGRLRIRKRKAKIRQQRSRRERA